MEHSALGTQRRQATPRSAHAPRDLRRLVGRAFRRDIRHRREAPSFALVHPRHVLDLRSLNSARRRHFYSTMLPNRNRCISLITNDRDTFYSTKNRPGPAHLLPRRMPPPPAKKGVKPCQVFCSVSHSKRRIGTQNKCQQNEVSSVARWYIFVVYIQRKIGTHTMAKTGTAKLFRNGRSQAVRLPREFRFEGEEVRIRRVPQGVLLEPMILDTAAWFAELDRLNTGSFMKAGRRQPKMPRRKIFD